jgi:hypothetical protein
VRSHQGIGVLHFKNGILAEVDESFQFLTGSCAGTPIRVNIRQTESWRGFVQQATGGQK